MARDVEAQLNYIESLISSVDAQIDAINKMVLEVQTTIQILSSDELRQSKERLISVGSGIFANGNLDLDSDLIVPIGSGVYIAEKRSETIERLKANIENLKESIQKLMDQRRTLVDQYNTVYTTEATRNIK
ncbi:hypothetical protein [Thermoplasma volcanium GSS1]|uniref:Prefoldin subunit alpha n=1 Tax=Thermoplasma volcanium (strain ATCC 51530 / DSM 4299 / JCM 9571 / NBRC 15438 / GSS1) TaxID=273116 RepID=PFDA_THEVO|nr:prefoldin subunit alpha [Thermoplasma volcanium]Q97BC5.1 RecName: Full=Prefoldin subunit alpha; AltName: Full=GimC subunit alpha [Thermoplasma volcanium GSS1]BAB59673.1 hypothetical protein [Thermoplasma volcanium GSS1]